MTTCLLERIKLTVAVLDRYPEFPLEETLWPRSPAFALSSSRMHCEIIGTDDPESLWKSKEGERRGQNASEFSAEPISARRATPASSGYLENGTSQSVHVQAISRPIAPVNQFLECLQVRRFGVFFRLEEPTHMPRMLQTYLRR